MFAGEKVKSSTSAVALLLLSAACGSPTAPSVAAVGGVWTYDVVVASITGGECLESPIQSAVGNKNHGTLSITQTGATLTATSRTNGPSCAYAGTAGGSSFALSSVSCDNANITSLICPNGDQRDLLARNNRFDATVNGNSAVGTQVFTYDVIVKGTSTSVGTIVFTATLTATK